MIRSLSFPSLIPSTPPTSLRSPSTSSTQEIDVPLNVNNRVIYVDGTLEKDARNAVALISRNYSNAVGIKREVILNPAILIALLNMAKLYWHSWVSKTQGENNASDRIECAFINNKNLSKEESYWVKKTIETYKNNIECAIAQGKML